MALASDVVLTGIDSLCGRGETAGAPEGARPPLSAGAARSTVTACRAPLSCYRHGVADQRALEAVARIERALARIERIASRPPPPDMSAEHDALRDSHDRMKSRVTGALAQLDALIAAGERR